MEQKLKDYTGGKTYYTPDKTAEKCFESLKKLIDLYKLKN